MEAFSAGKQVKPERMKFAHLLKRQIAQKVFSGVRLSSYLPEQPRV